MMNIISFIQAHSGALAAAGIFVIQEIIAFAPGLQANSILQLILSGLKKLGGS